MSEIKITIDADRVRARLHGLERQIPFAISKALNDTIRQAQKTMQDRMPQAFHLRTTEKFFRRAVKAQFSTKAKLEGNIRIEGPETITGPDKRITQAILRHEKGGSRSSAMTYIVNGRNESLGFFLPAKGLRTANANPPRALYPANIGALLRRDAGGKSFLASSQKGRKRMRGQEGRERSYFVMPTGIYERRHFGRFSATRLIWSFRRTITLRPSLGFYRTVQGSVSAHLTGHVQRAVDLAIRTAFHGPVPPPNLT